MCGDTEVPIEQLEDYVGNILSVANERSDHTNIELQFKVHILVWGCVNVTLHLMIPPIPHSLTETGSRQVRCLPLCLCQ